MPCEYLKIKKLKPTICVIAMSIKHNLEAAFAIAIAILIPVFAILVGLALGAVII